MLSLLFFFLHLYVNNFRTIEKLFTFSGNFQKSYINYNTRLELSELLHILHAICVRRLATSAYKLARLGKSLLLVLSRRSGQTYPLVADRVASHPFNQRSAARHCEIRPPT